MARASSKISSTFAARMKAGRPKAPVRALLLLSLAQMPAADVSGAPSVARRSTAAAIKKAAGSMLPLVDAILRKHDGKRLSETPDAFGSLVIEAPPSGILELAKQPWTRAIIEDQPVTCSNRL